MHFDADDLAAFNDPDMPGYAVATIGGVDVAGRFRAGPFDVMNVVEAFAPTFTAASGDLAGVAVDATVVIDATTYKVARRHVGRPVGHTTLDLKE